jgi:diketogulonate reductase-like aldo/keto reductase
MNVDSKRTKPLTFRIETKILEKIREEGGNNQISVSNFINKILKRYVEWDSYEPKVEENKHTFIMKHGMGENWSLYHKTIFELISNENSKNPVEIKYNSRIISIEFCE